MPPKTKITKQDILSASVKLIQKNGADSLNARSIAKELGCSTQPLFSNYTSMNELRTDVIECVYSLYREYLFIDIANDKYPPYKASGMAYIRFAMEEKELFKLLFMRDRSGERISEEPDEINMIIDIISKNTGLSSEKARKLHLQMWIYVHGIATMAATSYLPWDVDDVSRMLTEVYFAIKQSYIDKEL